MEYEKLAAQFMEQMAVLSPGRPHKQINESMRGEAFVLRYLDAHHGPIPPGEISGAMGISSARMATALNSMERKGLVLRKADPNDRRRILVCLTDKGKALAEERYQEVLQVTAGMLSLLGKEDAEELVRIMGRMVKILPPPGRDGCL
jgi:DNA-binding MarR family transcriptional regulator